MKKRMNLREVQGAGITVTVWLTTRMGPDGNGVFEGKLYLIEDAGIYIRERSEIEPLEFDDDCRFIPWSSISNISWVSPKE